MKISGWSERSKIYIKHALGLLRHPFTTIRYLATQEETNGTLYLLTTLAVYITVMIFIAPSFYDLLMTNGSNAYSLPGIMLFHFYVLLLPIICLFGYVFWPVCCYIIWKTLRILGATNTYQNLVFGLSHFLILLAVLGTMLVLSLFYKVFLSESNQYLLTVHLLNGLSLCLFVVISWIGLLAIHFVKVTSGLSYVKAIIGLGVSIACIDLLLFVLLPKML